LGSREDVRAKFYVNVPRVALLGIVIVWGTMLFNNLGQLPSVLGFDRSGHLFYIDYIRHNGTLPLADEGWQTYQPPLYYVTATAMLEMFRLLPDVSHVSWQQICQTTDWHSNGALLFLRGFSGFIGLALVGLVFLCLREVFPRQSGPKTMGV